jgi:DNA helicase HerA-like ATPase
MAQVIIGESQNGTVGIELEMANRHGFVTGSTGSGKTVTLETLAEKFSRAGVPVFAADIKGDLSGICQETKRGPGNPVKFWDIYGKNGQSIRIRVAQLGPQLLSRLLDATEAQERLINIAFHVAAEKQKCLDTLRDLHELLNYMVTNAGLLVSSYGDINTKSIGVLLSKIKMMESQIGVMFGRTNFSLEDLMQHDGSGAGFISLLDATKLIEDPKLYSTFLLWLLNELFLRLPEVGDCDKPKLVFFFDESHLLFRDASKQLMDMIERVVRLIRSKGVGVYFVTQKPTDIPDEILAQLNNRVQHALRAYTDSEMKGLKAAAKSFRRNPEINTEEAIQNLKRGEALVSTLDREGVPQVVQAVKVKMPDAKIGPMDPNEPMYVFRPKLIEGPKPVVQHELPEGMMIRTVAVQPMEPIMQYKPTEDTIITIHVAGGYGEDVKLEPQPKKKKGHTFKTLFAAVTVIAGAAAWAYATGHLNLPI